MLKISVTLDTPTAAGPDAVRRTVAAPSIARTERQRAMDGFARFGRPTDEATAFARAKAFFHIGAAAGRR